MKFSWTSQANQSNQAINRSFDQSVNQSIKMWIYTASIKRSERHQLWVRTV